MSNLNQSTLYIGTYTKKLGFVHGQAKGIYHCQLNGEGNIKILHTTSGIENPSYLMFSPNRNYLYAVQEGSSIMESGVFAFAIDPQTNTLSPLNHQPIPEGSPCHLCINDAGTYLFVANYLGGNVQVFPLAADGRIQPRTDLIQHSGSGPNTQRQEGPHAHMALFSPNDSYLLVSDLGSDAILVYTFDAVTGKLHQHSSVTAVNPGAGPRHMAFHPNGRILFVCNELDSTITSFHFANGNLTPLQTLSTLPEDFARTSACAAIRVGENGRFVYVSNRFSDNIATFTFDQQTEQLTLIDNTPTQGKTPRDFIVNGNTMLVANQDSSTITHFHINPANGLPEYSGTISEIPSPVCLLI